MFKLNIFDKLSFFLVIIGAINWGSIGLINKNFIYYLAGGSSIILRIIYVLIFLAALDLLYLLVKGNVIKIKA
ncbi:DUF378 domain-containing protein [Clostridium sp. NSJ-49]|mgnify:CR=1 FL=1|uniref:Domain of uncharacterized function (DUF378) n=1 Tax=Clostridium disporicum TaxID=84024 RepID=A0A173Y4V5_9CLOT|nr:MULTISPECIES: DUF378 domain-containing protein [Clostridium]MBC5626812.1 DUF378 domain-containing protein [Clostridium sp. NSJ-49]MCD2500976.1 DUF378 domain-containing protein [Clostridium sp. NSJ-145]MDU6339711.1 DUF378 domain-containing protein [Clostridium sp.]CUN59191.1 Domain of uncharacterised function (DUF378) [Clostridium disporicum]